MRTAKFAGEPTNNLYDKSGVKTTSRKQESIEIAGSLKLASSCKKSTQALDIEEEIISPEEEPVFFVELQAEQVPDIEQEIEEDGLEED